jgi:fumarate hydratase class II
LIKAAAAQANLDLGLLPEDKANAIVKAALQVADGAYDTHFPIDIFQTGSGTSTNMNANEVIATLATQSGTTIHPNDDVNNGQSSNDVIPAAIHVAAALEIQDNLLPSLRHLLTELRRRAEETDGVIKTGRTH